LRQAGRWVRLHRGQGPQPAVRRHQHPDRGVGDGPNPAAQGQHRIGHRGGTAAGPAVKTARDVDVTGQVLCRADSAYYRHAFVGAVLRHHAWFSVTARMNPQVKAAIADIDEDCWTPIEYPHAVFDDTEGRWVSDTEVAEVPFVAFTSRRKAEHVACRLVVRRVRRLQPPTGDGTTQGELFAAHRHRAFITKSTLPTLEADHRHRDHAIVEQVVAELKNGPLAHLPSGRYAANAAWAALAVIAFNLARATAVAASPTTARWATLRTRILPIPARIVATGRRLILHLPRAWTWASTWNTLWVNATGPPSAATPSPPGATKDHSGRPGTDRGHHHAPNHHPHPRHDNRNSTPHHRWIRSDPAPLDD